MSIVYDLEKLKNVFNDFYNVTGINVNLVKTDFLFVECNLRFHCDYCKKIQSSSEGRKKCYLSDTKLLKKCRESKKPEMHICHAGLVDIAIPIIDNDSVLGYLILGQFRQSCSFDEAKKCIAESNLDLRKMEEYYKLLPTPEEDKLRSIINIVSMLARHILKENMMKTELKSSIKRAVTFINSNLANHLTLKEISESINVSKSVLYRDFHRFFNCTVNDYVKIKRVEKSIYLLLNTDLSIEEISQKTGFSNVAYFSRIFKESQGMPPIKFRKEAMAARVRI